MANRFRVRDHDPTMTVLAVGERIYEIGPEGLIEDVDDADVHSLLTHNCEHLAGGLPPRKRAKKSDPNA